MGGIGEAYRVLGASEKLYKSCGKAADYFVSKEARKKDEVERLEDGEEVGRPVDKTNVWHSSEYPPFSPFAKAAATAAIARMGSASETVANLIVFRSLQAPSDL